MKRSIAFGVVAASLTLLLSAPPASATFKGKNGRIAFAQDRGDGSEIYTMTSDGTDRRRLTDQEASAWFPSWSPDGTQMVFALNRPGEECGSIELMKADGTDVVDLTSVSARLDGICGQGPSFTPDGRRIVFAGWSLTPPTAIWSFDLRGRNVRRIITTRRIERVVHGDKEFVSPRVSPDGRTLCFEVEHSFRNGANLKGLFTIRMNGRHLRQIVPFAYDVTIKGGTWAPNGNRILFSDNGGYSGQTVFTEPQNIYTLRPDGTDLRQLTHFRTLPPDVGAAAGSYSPDGRWIIFKRVNNDRFTLWKIRPDGTDLTRITRLRFWPTGAVEWGPRP